MLINQQVGHEGLFSTEGNRILIDSYPPEKAVAISDSLFGREIELAVTCDQQVSVPVEDSCVVFKLNFTNSRCVPGGASLSWLLVVVSPVDFIIAHKYRKLHKITHPVLSFLHSV